MQFDELVERVQERAGLADRPVAERATIVVVQHLCDHLTGDEAHDLLAQLPAKLRRPLFVGASAQPLSADEFVSRIGQELEVSAEEATTRIRAVLATIREAVSSGEFEDVMMQLEPEYGELLG